MFHSFPCAHPGTQPHKAVVCDRLEKALLQGRSFCSVLSRGQGSGNWWDFLLPAGMGKALWPLKRLSQDRAGRHWSWEAQLLTSFVFLSDAGHQLCFSLLRSGCGGKKMKPLLGKRPAKGLCSAYTYTKSFWHLHPRPTLGFFGAINSLGLL